MKMDTERLLERLAAGDADAAGDRAPARLKSTIYSSLVTRLAEDGPLRSLRATGADGSHLCVFEKAVAILPAGEGIHAKNPCRVCHARVLGERLARAPIFWPGCPYADFHRG